MSQRRKLAAILSADVVGYSRLMGQDELETVSTLQSYRAVIQALVAAHQGRVINTPGDALLSEFPSAVEAVRCASEIQDEIERRNADLPAERRMRFRIGVNLGDVIEEADGTLYGDGVNVTARLEALAEAGGVCVSGKVFEEVEGRVNLTFESAGEQVVKNIAKPLRVYRVRPETSKTPRPFPRIWPTRWKMFAAIMVIALAGGTAIWWQASRGFLPAKDPSLAAPTGLTVAVLPFANLSGDPNQDFFADGITEQIITGLARFRDLAVIARNSSFSYKGKLVDLDAFAPAAKRAVALNPNNVDVLAFYGLLWTYAHMGNPAERARGVEAMKRAIGLSPTYPSWYHFPIGWHLYFSGEYQAALAEAKKIDLPGYFHTHVLLVTIYGAMGRKEQASASVKRLLELYPEFPRNCRDEWRKWNMPEPMIDRAIRDLRRAGVDVPEGT